MDRLQDRERWFGLLGAAYRSTGQPQGELRICTACPDPPCEVGPEQVTFLPWEDEFIHRRLAAAGRHVPIETVRAIAGCERCPFHVQGRCAIHPHRPIDCRTYPLVPRFSGVARVEFTVSSVCPLRSGIDKPFIKLMADVWASLLPHLPTGWKERYAERQPIERLERLTNRA